MSVTIDGNPGASTVTIDGNPGASQVVIASPAIADVDFQLEAVTAQDTISGSSSGQTTILDVVYDQQTGATVETHVHLLPTGNESFAFQSLDTGIATVSALGETAWVSNGTARVLVKGTSIWKNHNCTVSRAGGQTSNTFNSYAAGSLAKLASDSIDNAIAGKTLAENGPLFSSMNHDSAVYSRNPNSWPKLAGIDCTGISVWNNARPAPYGQWQHGIVIHERIILLAKHYSPPVPVGTTVRFVDNNNNVVDRTVDAVSSPIADIYLARFSAPLPAAINVLKVLPPNWHTYLPSISITQNIGQSVPIFVSDQLKYAYVYDWSNSYNGIWVKTPVNAQRSAFTKAGGFVTGDSGSPQCLVVGGQLVVLASILSNSLIQFLSELDAAMDALLTGAATSKLSMSGYNAY